MAAGVFVVCQGAKAPGKSGRKFFTPIIIMVIIIGVRKEARCERLCRH